MRFRILGVLVTAGVVCVTLHVTDVHDPHLQSFENAVGV